jgi:Dna[CI] antecedent, DciA
VTPRSAGRRTKYSPGPPRRKEAISAGLLIAETLSQHGLTEQVRGLRVVAEWDQLVGARIAKRARPEEINRRVLRVSVASSAWMHELGLLKPQLLLVLWNALGEPRLFDDISFQLAGRTRAATDAPGVAPQARPSVPPTRVPVAALGPERAQILSETSAVDDDELRELIARVRTRHNR